MKEGHNILFDKKVQRFQNKVNKYFAHLLGGFFCFFVYEHAHLTADYRGRDHAHSSLALSRAEAGGGSWRGEIEVFIRGVITSVGFYLWGGHHSPIIDSFCRIRRKSDARFLRA